MKTKSKVVNLTVHEVYKTVIRDHPTASNEWICHELDCLWKTHPILNSIILGHDTGRFLENSSKIEHLVEKLNSKNSGAWHRPIFYKKKRNRYSQKIDGWIFQKSVKLMPWKLKFRKKTGWVFQKSVCVTPRKTEVSEKLDEFSGICQ